MEYEGVIYHVMNRGDRGETVFRDDSDRKLFLETLGEACAKTDWQVHALCLMGNHFHFGGRDAQGESGGRDEVVAGHLHGAVQSEHGECPTGSRHYQELTPLRNVVREGLSGPRPRYGLLEVECALPARNANSRSTVESSVANLPR